VVALVSIVWGVKMSEFRPFRRQVSIDRDGEDFVITFRPLNIGAIRHSEAAELRKICHHLRWQIVSDTVPDPDDIRSWPVASRRPGRSRNVKSPSS
jgi:hypothetical protein